MSIPPETGGRRDGSPDPEMPLCLRFANTAPGARAPADAAPGDPLASYDAFLEWAAGAGAVGEGDASRLRAEGKACPEEAAAVLRRAELLRAALRRLFLAAGGAGGGRPPEPADLDLLNREWGRALGRLRLARRRRRYSAEFSLDPRALDRPLWRVAASAADLLLDGRLERVKACAASDCERLFVDGSRNRSRRWCDMAGCGNRAKQRRHYRRRKTGGPAGEGAAGESGPAAGPAPGRTREEGGEA